MMSVHNDPFPGKVPSLPQPSSTKPPSPDLPVSPIDVEMSASIIQKSSHHLQQPIRAQLITPVEIETLEDDEQEIKTLLAHAEAVNPEQSIESKKWIDAVTDKVIEKLLKRNGVKSEKENAPNVSRTLNVVSDVEFDGPNAELLEPLLLEEAFFREVAGLEIGVVAVNVLSRATTAMAIGMLLSKVSDVIKAKESRLAEVNDTVKNVLTKEILLLKKWLIIQNTLFDSQWKKSLVMSSLSMPKGAAGIARLVAGTGSTAAEVIGFVGLGTSLVRSAIQIHETTIDLEEHQEWAQTFQNNGMEAQDVQSILDRQQGVFESRLKTNEPVLHKLLDRHITVLKHAEQLNGDEQAKVLENVLKNLKEAGISVPVDKLSVKELQEWLSDPSQRPILNKMMVQKKEALSVSIRNSLKTFSKKKEEIDRGFLKLTLNKAKGVFTATAVITTLTIVLKVLVIVGIAAASVALTVTGYGMLAIVLVGLIVGAIYLYVKKPNLFKTYVQGVQANLFFRKIPLAIQNYRRHYTQLQASKVSEDVKMLGIRILAVDQLLLNDDQNEILAYLKEHSSKKISDETLNVNQRLIDYRSELLTKKDKTEQKYVALSEKVESLTQSVFEMEVKVNELKDRIERAGWKDFHRHLSGKEHLTDMQGNTLDYADVLIDFLLEDPTLLEDSETEKLLEYMEIDMKAIRALPRDVIKDESLKVVRSFFAMDEGSTLEMIKRQNIKRNSMVENEQ